MLGILKIKHDCCDHFLGFYNILLHYKNTYTAAAVTYTAHITTVKSTTCLVWFQLLGLIHFQTSASGTEEYITGVGEYITGVGEYITGVGEYITGVGDKKALLYTTLD